MNQTMYYITLLKCTDIYNISNPKFMIFKSLMPTSEEGQLYYEKRVKELGRLTSIEAMKEIHPNSDTKDQDLEKYVSFTSFVFSIYCSPIEIDKFMVNILSIANSNKYNRLFTLYDKNLLEITIETNSTRKEILYHKLDL
jgi:hypothetical protein